MIAPVVVFILLGLLAIEGLALVVTEVRLARRESAYWDAKANRPALYDWAKELDL